MNALSHPQAIFAQRRRQAAELRAGRKPYPAAPAEGMRQIAEQPEAKPMALAADKPVDRPKLPSPLFLTGGSINFY